MSPLVAALLGLAVGLAVGALATRWLMRRPSMVGAVPGAGPPPVQRPAAAEPSPISRGRPAQGELPLADEELKPAIRASRDLLADLEGRYGQPGPEPVPAEKPLPRRPPRPRRKPGA